MKIGKSKIYKHPNAATLYLTIPADVVKDSTFPFKEGDVVSVMITEDAENDVHKGIFIALQERKNEPSH